MRRSSLFHLLVLPPLLCAACSSNDPPQPLPSQTTTTVTPRLEPPPPLPPPVREIKPSAVETVTVIDAGDPDQVPRTLLEASRYAKEQKADQRQASIVINDDNLHEYTEGVEIMRMEGEPAHPAPTLQPAASARQGGVADPYESLGSDREVLGRPAPDQRDETYWRSRALELRMGWRRAMDEAEDLELEAAALRQEFYAQDDNYVRDAQIKPAWDRVLDRILLLEEKAERYSRELDTFVAEGQQAGVPQGWLNAGWELGPSAQESPADAGTRTIDGFGVHQSSEPADAPQTTRQ